MKKWLLLALALSGILGSLSGARAASDSKKSPADLAADEFYRIRNLSRPSHDLPIFQKIINAGVSYLLQYPTHARAVGVVRDLGNYGTNTFPDKKRQPLRLAYNSLLQVEVIRARSNEGLDDEAKKAVAALGVAAIEAATRAAPKRSSLEELRQKIDALAEIPGISRFLVPAERSYLEIMTKLNPAEAEGYLRTLSDHADPAVAKMAQGELRLWELRNKPLAEMVPALDGSTIDFQRFHGNVLAVVFWNTENAPSVKVIDAFKRLYAGYHISDYQKERFEMVAVSLDKESNREKVMEFVKDRKTAWPVVFDGKQAQGDLAVKFNVGGTPTILIFNQKGLLHLHNLKDADRAEVEIRKLLGYDQKP